MTSLFFNNNNNKNKRKRLGRGRRERCRNTRQWQIKIHQRKTVSFTSLWQHILGVIINFDESSVRGGVFRAKVLRHAASFRRFFFSLLTYHISPSTQTSRERKRERFFFSFFLSHLSFLAFKFRFFPSSLPVSASHNPMMNDNRTRLQLPS